MLKWFAISVLALLCLGTAAGDDDFNHTANDVRALPDRTTMHKYNVAHIDDQAACNDGSSGVYYHRIGRPLNSTRFVIRFLGGAWCWDKGSCQTRRKDTPYLMSTAMLPDNTSATEHVDGIPDKVMQSAGITSIEAFDNPDFHSWAHVHIWYCSSDSHLGDIAAGQQSELGDWQFRGKRIAAAVIEDLFQQHGLADATHVLLTGDSAGGVGAMNNADWIGGMLRQRAPQLESYKVFVDAGWFMDIAPYASRKDGFTFQKAARALAGPLNATFDRSCMDFYGEEDSWRCFFAASCYGHIETPTLFHEYLYDSANLGYDSAAWSQYNDFRSKLTASIKGQPAASWNVTESNNTLDAPASTPANLTSFAEYAEGQSTALQPEASVAGMSDMAPAPAVPVPVARDLALSPQSSNMGDIKTASGRRPNMFAPACHLHEMEDGMLFTRSSIGHAWLVDILADWYADRTPDVFVLDHHEGLQSDALCGTDPKASMLLAAAMARYLVLEAGRNP